MHLIGEGDASDGSLLGLLGLAGEFWGSGGPAHLESLVRTRLGNMNDASFWKDAEPARSVAGTSVKESSMKRDNHSSSATSSLYSNPETKPELENVIKI